MRVHQTSQDQEFSLFEQIFSSPLISLPMIAMRDVLAAFHDEGHMMVRVLSKRILMIGGLAVAVGCRSTTPDPMIGHAPLLPGEASPPPMITGPNFTGPSNVATGPIPNGAPIVATGPLITPPILPPGASANAQHGPYALVRTVPNNAPSSAPTGAVLPQPRTLTKLPETLPMPMTGPALPEIVTPKDAAPAVPAKDTPKLADMAPPLPEILPLPKPTGSSLPGPIVEPTKVAAKTPETDPFLAASRVVIPPERTGNLRTPSEETRPTDHPLKDGQKFGHASDYRWVAGILDYHQRGGYWTIRYADFAEDDRWGGKVRLVDDARLKERKVGDIVYISGELLAPVTTASAENRTTFPPYRITELKLVEAAK